MKAIFSIITVLFSTIIFGQKELHLLDLESKILLADSIDNFIDNETPKRYNESAISILHVDGVLSEPNSTLVEGGFSTYEYFLRETNQLLKFEFFQTSHFNPYDSTHGCSEIFEVQIYFNSNKAFLAIIDQQYYDGSEKFGATKYYLDVFNLPAKTKHSNEWQSHLIEYITNIVKGKD